MTTLPPLGGFFPCVLYLTSMSDKTYAMFNVLTLEGRISHAEIKKGKYGEFLSCTLLTELMNDTEAVAVEFTSTNGLMTLFKNGHLNNGRRLTVTGHLESFSELYLNKETGKRAVRKRPMIKLGKVQVLDGGIGPGKKEEEVTAGDKPAVDDTPEY